MRFGGGTDALGVGSSEVVRSDLGEGFSDLLVGCLASHGQVSLGDG